jgi:small subunit ribosomal protein S9
MADEPQKDEPQKDEPREEAEQPKGEAESSQPEAEETTPEESPDEGGEASPEQADAEDPEEGGEEAPQEGGEPAAEGKEAGKKGPELPPGAELDPIALEPERELSAEDKARLEAEAEEKARLEAEATAEAPEEQTVATARTPAQLAAEARYMATGKRKRSIARVLITPGDGKFEINRRSLQEYFPRPLHQSTALQPLSVSGYEGTVDVRVNVQGGGIGGQAGAVRHGIARALTEIDPELRKELKRRGFLTRDARVKERRKAGLKKARKRPQFSKR